MSFLPTTKSGSYTLLFIVALLAVSTFLGLEKPADASVDVFLAPEVLFYIGTFPITNSFFWSIFLSVVMMAGAIKLSYSLKQQPGSFQNLAEAIIEGGYKFIGTINRNEKQAKIIFPLAFSMFLFILVTNLFSFLPGSSAIKLGDAALFRSVMADYTVVFMLTLITVIGAQILAIIANGPIGYLGKFLNFSSPLNFALGIMDIIGELSKVLSLSFRLFGNVFAGEVLAAVMLFLMPFFLPLPFLFMGLLSAVIQAFVFSLLTTIFLTMAWEAPASESPVAT
jgi:F-type H+-transporting ATPase subunit a